MAMVQYTGQRSSLSAATLRRRRTLAVLLGATTLSVVMAAGAGTAPAWTAASVVAGLSAAYLALLHRARRIATERAFERWATPAAGDFGAFAEMCLADHTNQVEATVDRPDPGPMALIRFALAYAAGWALAPVVFALTLLAGRTPKDATSQRWLANIEAAQDRLREQSLRTLALSAATTASVTAAGTIAVLGPAGAASASPASAALPASPVLSAAASMVTHRVVAGDTVWGLAGRYGTTVAAIVSANHLANAGLIFPGQVLVIPGGPGGSAPASVRLASGTYTVRPGDTLWAIANRFGTTVAALASANGISNPNVIQVGQVLTLRGSGTSGGATVTRTRLPAPRPVQPSPPAATAAQTAVHVALAQVGKPYQWAGAGPNTFDCSGLVMYAWAHAGVQLPHYSVAQYQDTTRITQAQLRPGDLVFYDTGDGAQPGHVTIYIGNGQVVTADSPGTDVRVVSLTWDGNPMGYGRVP